MEKNMGKRVVESRRKYNRDLCKEGSTQPNDGMYCSATRPIGIIDVVHVVIVGPWLKTIYRLKTFIYFLCQVRTVHEFVTTFMVIQYFHSDRIVSIP